MTKSSVGSYIKLPHTLIRTEAWANLSARAWKLLIAIWNEHNGKNNGALRYGYRKATVLLKCSKSTALRTFTELVNTGYMSTAEQN